MCGICGEIRFDGIAVNVSAVRRMMQRMVPRGPDAEGLYLQGAVSFGHRRLRIIDLSDKARQPMEDPELGLTIVFNGCIYNYRALRAELEQKGYRFFAHSDTEVILKAYHAWGSACVERFHGMFAFAIAERDSGRVIWARDRLGIKPLYYAEFHGGVRFASTLPALLAAGGVDRTLDPVALHHYLTFHSIVPPPHTILKGVRKLPPATVRTIEPDGRHTDHTYWTLEMTRQPGDESVSFQTWQTRVEEALRLAVRRRLEADVPVGVLLSGGLDSSLIVGLLAEEGQGTTGLETFSVGFEEVHGEKGDEFYYSDIIARHFGTTHHKIMVASDRLLENLPNTIASQSEPMVSHDNVGFFLLSELVSKRVKVVQSGQGADEVFAGYHWYPPMLASDDPVTTYKDVFFDRNHADYCRSVFSPLDKDVSLAFVEQKFAEPGAQTGADKALRLDATVMLVDDPVKRVDNMTMAWGLEARVPFLDHELVELAGRIPPRFKVAEGGKHVLKEVARRVIPHEVIDRPKGYFPVPALKYLEGPVLDLVQNALTDDTARQRHLFRSEYVDMLLKNPTTHITHLGGSKLWQLGLLELWLRAHDI